jgi:hypothetical protein
MKSDAMNETTQNSEVRHNPELFQFFVRFDGDTQGSFESYPIFDDIGHLIGTFTVLNGHFLRCVVSISNPIGLDISMGRTFWFTPDLSTGIINGGSISSIRTVDGIKVNGGEHIYDQ